MYRSLFATDLMKLLFSYGTPEGPYSSMLVNWNLITDHVWHDSVFDFSLQQICFFQQFYIPRADYMALRLSFITVSIAEHKV